MKDQTAPTSVGAVWSIFWGNGTFRRLFHAVRGQCCRLDVFPGWKSPLVACCSDRFRGLFQAVWGQCCRLDTILDRKSTSVPVARAGSAACPILFGTALPVGYHSGSEIDVRCLLFGTVPWLAPCRSRRRCRLGAIPDRGLPFTARCSRRSVACFRSFGRRCRFDGAAACSILFGALTV